MPRQKKWKRDERIVVDTALGLCAWALVIEMMVVLERRGVIRTKDSLTAIAGSIRGLEALMENVDPHPALPVAIAILKGQIDGWRDHRKG